MMVNTFTSYECQVRRSAVVVSLFSLAAAVLLVVANENAAMAALGAGLFCAFLVSAPPFWIAILLVISIPFHSLFQELLGGFGSSSRQLFVLWKELLLGIGLIRVFWHNSNRKRIFAANRWVFAWSSLLLGVYVVTFLRGPSFPGIVSLGLETRFLGVMLFFMFLNLGEEQIAKLLRAMIWSVSLIALYGLIQYAWDYDRLLSLVYYAPGLIADESHRLYSYSLNVFDPAYGAMIAILILFSGCGRLKLRAALLWSTFLIPCLLLTYTRSAYLGLFAGIIALCVSDREHFRRYVAIACVASCLVCGFLLLDREAVLNSSLGQRLYSISSLNDDSSISHKDRMEMAARVVLANPFGIGLGKYGAVQARFAGGINEADATENWVLQVAVQTGVIGAFAYLALSGAILISLMRPRQSRVSDANQLRASASGVFLAMTVAGMMITVWDLQLPVVYAWALVGTALGDGRTRRHGLGVSAAEPHQSGIPVMGLRQSVRGQTS